MARAIFTRIKLLTSVLACARAIVRIKWRLQGKKINVPRFT